MSLTPAAALAAVSRSGGMIADETVRVLDLLMAKTLTPEQGAEILVAWSKRGETGIELATVVQGLLRRAAPAPTIGACFDLCGTGGSYLTRYNVSTTVAFVLAAAGVPVAKHGNKGSLRPNGSFDLLEHLGVPYLLAPAAQERLVKETSICFLFARAMHPAVAAVAPFRKLAAATVKRTIFNLAGPLANPCRPTCQLIGVPDEHTAQVVADAIGRLGMERAVVVRGHPGIDEVSITGPTHIWHVAEGHTKHAIIEAGRHLPNINHADLPGGDAPQNAELFLAMLNGAAGPLTDMVVANAAVALDCWLGHPPRVDGDSAKRARVLLVGGAVKKIFEKHIALAKELAERA
jgi:anthranilate phosphoribosyltransferase